MPLPKPKFSWLPTIGVGVVVWFVLSAVYLAYLPALTGTFHYDDEPNLRELSQVTDAWSALRFIASGPGASTDRSILGNRPLARASFLINHTDWELSAYGFLRLNILIHILNGALVAWLTIKLLRLSGHSPYRVRSSMVAVGASALWLCFPILASASLIVIQRMTGLSATFVLTGLIFYLAGLEYEKSGRFKTALLFQWLGIVGGTGLAVLCKENGILLPLFAIITELTILSRISKSLPMRGRRVTALTVFLIIVTCYIGYSILATSFAHREFSVLQRLVTQPTILLDYVRLAFLPQAAQFSPFHDEISHFDGINDTIIPSMSIFAVATFLLLAIFNRRRYPLFSFAVFWFLGGHLLESTAIPLELYFEHRNYMPLVGPAIALSWWGWTQTGRWRVRAPALLASYNLLLFFVLIQTTSLWGQPLLSAEMWALRNPDSPRAQQYLAQRYFLAGQSLDAINILDKATTDNSTRAELPLQSALLSCYNRFDEKAIGDFSIFRDRISTAPFSNGTLDTLAALVNALEAQTCEYPENADLLEVIDELLPHKKYQQPHVQAYLYYLSGRLYRQQGNLDATLRNMIASFSAFPRIEYAKTIVATFASAGLYDDALVFIEESRQDRPRIWLNPILYVEWSRALSEYEEKIRLAKNERQQQTTRASARVPAG